LGGREEKDEGRDESDEGEAPSSTRISFISDPGMKAYLSCLRAVNHLFKGSDSSLVDWVVWKFTEVEIRGIELSVEVTQWGIALLPRKEMGRTRNKSME